MFVFESFLLQRLGVTFRIFKGAFVYVKDLLSPGTLKIARIVDVGSCIMVCVCGDFTFPLTRAEAFALLREKEIDYATIVAEQIVSPVFHGGWHWNWTASSLSGNFVFST